MLILALGDLYVPERAGDLPAKFKRLLQPRGKIDKVLCLGNVTSSQSTLNFLKSIADDFQMVRGEFDDDLTLSNSLVFQVDNLKIGLINGFQITPKNDPLSLLNHARMMDVDVLIYGSTHKVEAYTLDGKFFINPGTATGAYSTDPLDAEDKAALAAAGDNDAGDNDAVDDVYSPCPSFCLLDTAGEPDPDASASGTAPPTPAPADSTPTTPAACTLYLYTLVDGDVKIDKLAFAKQ